MAKLLYPPSIDWELTDACNHRCLHCYNYWRQSGIYENDKTKEYYIEAAKKIIDAHPVSVQITGGEPLLKWSDVKDAIDLLIKNGVVVSFNTNATYVTEDIAHYMGENKLDVFISFPCSDFEIFDEIVNCRGAAERARKGIHLLNKYRARTSLNMVVIKKNMPYVYKTAKYVYEEFGAKYFSAAKASFPMGACPDFKDQLLSNEEFNEMLAELMRAKKDFGLRVDSAWVYSLCGFNDDVREQFGFNRKCTCGKYSFVLDAKGNIKACGCDAKAYGNIFENSFASAIDKMTKWQDGSMIPEICKKCRWLLYCGGGCRADALGVSGHECMPDSTARTSYSKDPLLQMHDISSDMDAGVYMLNPDVKYINDNGFIRISYKTNYEFISYRFAEYLMKKIFFSIKSLATACGKEILYVSDVIHKMKRKGLLVEAKGHVPAEIQCGFELLVSPYTEYGNEEWQNKYSGFEYSCKQFM